MNHKELYEAYEKGTLSLAGETIHFENLPWVSHPVFSGVRLKHIITSKETAGAFSYHLVVIDPEKRMGLHCHEQQVETHEIIAGSGVCRNKEAEYPYFPGVISLFEKATQHEVIAGEDGLFLFAKFFPPLC